MDFFLEDWRHSAMANKYKRSRVGHRAYARPLPALDTIIMTVCSLPLFCENQSSPKESVENRLFLAHRNPI